MSCSKPTAVSARLLLFIEGREVAKAARRSGSSTAHGSVLYCSPGVLLLPAPVLLALVAAGELVVDLLALTAGPPLFVTGAVLLWVGMGKAAPAAAPVSARPAAGDADTTAASCT
jgi:hypothetical protein